MTHIPAKRVLISVLALFLCSSLSACATKKTEQPPTPPAASMTRDDNATLDNNDSLEPLNRKTFKFNEVLDGVLLKPLAHIYLGVVPDPAQKGVKNALVNLSSPVVFLNSVLQWDIPNAEYSFSRFVLNSTVGIVGIFDVASWIGIPKQHQKDFGQTLGVYGVDTGPYLEVPIIGPSNIRDGVGLVVDAFADPFAYIFTWPEYIAYDTTRVIVTRADYLPLTEKIERDSFDPYSTYRSIYQQHRASIVRDYKNLDAEPEKQTGK